MKKELYVNDLPTWETIDRDMPDQLMDELCLSEADAEDLLHDYRKVGSYRADDMVAFYG